MGTCPVCNGAVPDDFGLVECESCGAQLIVHVDGSVEYSGADESAEAETPEAEAPVEEVDSAPIHHFADDELQLPADPEPDPESDLETQPAQELVAEPDAVFDDANEVFAEEEPQVYKSPTDPASPDLSDLEKFANSPDSGGREGPFKYTIMISGIDTSDVRLAFREALTDRKFMWDIEQILRSIRHGEVQIANVTPSKAYVLINRLRGLPVSVRWEQNAVTQA